MFTNTKLVNGLVRKISEVEKRTLDAWREGRIEQEPAITDRLLGVMEEVLNKKRFAGVQWEVKTLTDRGKGSQEAEFGADFMAVFKLSLDGYEVNKGFLAQAKLVEPSQSFNINEFDRLKKQCEKMLNLSPASFVFVYSQQSGIVVVPAIEVLAAQRPCNPHELINKKMRQFYQEHFECFIGDRNIHKANSQGLEELCQIHEARKLVFLSGTQGDLDLRDRVE
ncbi:MAG: hypothetical protein QNJ36_20915 [Calothrix sp. MO_167.B42]|nr:hypothetical protein [Calothrix sp. MO_167.B42]